MGLSNTTLTMLMATIDGSIVIIAMPAIFRGIHLSPLAPGNRFYVLWMIMGYLMVQAMLVGTLGRLGDMFGRFRVYNLGFVVFTVASIALSFEPFTGGPRRPLAYLVAGPAGVRRRNVDFKLGGNSDRCVPSRPAWDGARSQPDRRDLGPSSLAYC
jgi:MFS family permease